MLELNEYTVTVSTSNFPELAKTFTQIIAKDATSAKRKALFKYFGDQATFTGKLLVKIKKTGSILIP